MDNLILSPVPVNELMDLFTERLEAVLRTHQNNVLQEKLLTTAEVATRFSVSHVTINSWCVKGFLIKYSIGGRNYFKYCEVMESLKTLKKYKFK